MDPKVVDTGFAMRQSDALQSWCRSRDYQALLRSTGHLFRDGRWLGEDDDFHVYREIETPGFGVNRTFSVHPSYLKQGSGDPFGYELVTANWRPAVTRSAESEFFPEPTYNWLHLPPIETPDFADYVLNLNAQGTDFIVKNRPGNPAVQLGQYLIELRELPQVPRFLQYRAKQFSDLGKEYLNVEFGWKPFIKDLLKIHDLQFTIARRLAKLTEQNGLLIRRRSKKVVSTDSLVVCQGSLSVPFGDLGDTSIGGHVLLDGYRLAGPFGALVSYPGFGGQADYRLSTTTYTTAWSCGTFKYFVPDIGSNQWTERAVKALYDANVTPSVIYSVVPWTWLIDWFANVGDIMSNLSVNSVDNESLTNAFAMYTETMYDVVDVSLHWDSVDATSLPGAAYYLPAGDDVLKHTISRVNKLRHQASPFGFGLKREQFTARQLAILAALAVSRYKSWASWKRSFGSGEPYSAPQRYNLNF